MDARTSWVPRTPSQISPLTISPLTPSNSVRIEVRLHASAVAFQRAFGAGGVGALEDPVLPGGEAAEDLRLHRLGAGKAQVGLHAGETVGGEGSALLQKDAHLVLPIDVIERRGDEAEALAVLGFERLARLGFGFIDTFWLAEKAGGQPCEVVAHRVGAETEGREHDRGRRAGV